MIQNKIPNLWKAKWIDPELPHDKDVRQPASVLRRRFAAEKAKDAVLYITCHGLYEACLNGQRVGDFVLAPSTGDYAKRLTVQAYDVSDLLREGENELTVTLGDGWYRGSVGIDGLRNYYGEDISLLSQLEIRSDRQCEYVRPIAFGLLDRDEVQKAADTLNELVVKNGYHLNTGFLSTPDLCRVLAENGHADTACKLLLQPDCPGWLYSVRKGATTIWETWDGVRADGTVHDSLNHYSYGAISLWLFSGICGIRLEEGRLTIRPFPDRSLGYARAEWRSPMGTIRSAWEYKDEKLRFEFTLPVPATIELPNGKRIEAPSGEVRDEILV